MVAIGYPGVANDSFGLSPLFNALTNGARALPAKLAQAMALKPKNRFFREPVRSEFTRVVAPEPANTQAMPQKTAAKNSSQVLGIPRIRASKLDGPK